MRSMALQAVYTERSHLLLTLRLGVLDVCQRLYLRLIEWKTDEVETLSQAHSSARSTSEEFS